MKSYAVATVSLMTAIAALIAGTTPSDAQRNSDRHIAGKFDYYQLVLSWSPTLCRQQSWLQ